jgi:hypothetical protein
MPELKSPAWEPALAMGHMPFSASEYSRSAKPFVVLNEEE